MENKFIEADSQNIEEYLSSLQNRIDCIQKTVNECDIHISISNTPGVVTISVSVPLDAGAVSSIPSGIIECDDFCKSFVHDGFLVTKTHLFRESEDNISSFAEVITVLISKTKALKLVLEGLSYGE